MQRRSLQSWPAARAQSPMAPEVQNVSATQAAKAANRLPRQAAFFAMGFTAAGAACAAAIAARRGLRPRVELSGLGPSDGVAAGAAAAAAATAAE